LDSNQFFLGLGIVNSYFQSAFSKKTFYIPPGGSSPAGTLGYVNAFLELVEQVGTEGLPKKIYVPMGTAGTSAGLLVGSCLSGTLEKTTIVAVGINHSVLSNKSSILKLAKNTIKYLKKHLSKEDAEKIPNCFKERDTKGLSYRTEYSKPGYGTASAEVKEGIEIMRNQENII